MKKSKAPLIFALLESIVFISFTIGDASGKFSTEYIKYAGIALCFLYSLLNIGENKFRFLSSVAFAFTLAADYFLLLRGENFEAGVALFTVAQIFHFLRISSARNKISLASVISRIALTAIILVFEYAFGLLTPLNILVAVYFSNLLINCADGFAYFLKTKNALLFAGFLLFICCDICVGTANLGFNFSQGVRETLLVLCWTFYLPSQTLIALF